MKKVIKKKIGSIVLIGSLFLYIIITIVVSQTEKSLVSQRMSARWSKEDPTAQISIFASERTEIGLEQISELKYNIDKILSNSDFTEENNSKKAWTYTYSAMGEVMLDTKQESIKIKAVGVGEDFFLFHPFYLVKGAYFNKEDIMQDRIIIDKETAWLLFGSSDVVGMNVLIENVPHKIAGVIEKEKGILNDEAGNREPIIYLSYDSLLKYGKTNGIHTIELVLPNPISDFALSTVIEACKIEKREIEIINNSNRYATSSLLQVIKNFGTRSMNLKGIIYPYWENTARGWEDILSLLLLFRFCSLLLFCALCFLYIKKYLQTSYFPSRIKSKEY